MNRRTAAALAVAVSALAACGSPAGRAATTSTPATTISAPRSTLELATTPTTGPPTSTIPSTSTSSTMSEATAATPATVTPAPTATAPVPSTPLLFARTFDDVLVFSVSAPSEGATMSMLTVAGDTVLGLAGQCDTPDGVEVIGFDRHTGQTRWATPLDGSVTTRDWRVTVTDNVAVFETSDHTSPAGTGIVYGIDVRDGSQRWRRDAIAADLSVTVPVIIGQEAPDEFVAIDPATGTDTWRRQTSAATLVAVDGADLVIEQHTGPAQPDQTVTALDAATGTELWTRPAADFFAGDRDTIVFNMPDEAGVVAINRTTGAEKWHRDGLIMSAPSNPPTLGNGRLALYRQATGETMIASLATGQTLWPVDTTISTDASILGDTVVRPGATADGQPTLELLDASNGTHLATIHLPQLEHDQVDLPYIIHDGTLYGGRGCTGQG